MRIKMLHDHERHARARRQIAQQFHRRFKSARRAADADDRTLRFFAFPCIPRIDLAIANPGRAALFLLRLRGRTSTFRSWVHVLNNDLQLVSIQAAIRF